MGQKNGAQVIGAWRSVVPMVMGGGLVECHLHGAA
jgi:hypothetical protein